jgi:hypothetical protein
MPLRLDWPRGARVGGGLMGSGNEDFRKLCWSREVHQTGTGMRLREDLRFGSPELRRFDLYRIAARKANGTKNAPNLSTRLAASIRAISSAASVPAAFAAVHRNERGGEACQLQSSRKARHENDDSDLQCLL